MGGARRRLPARLIHLAPKARPISHLTSPLLDRYLGSMPPSPEFDRLASALAGHYALERELGRGGMGVVLLARDLRLDRLVALKTLPQHLADDEVIRERFLREARTAAKLSHPRIVPIHHAAEVDGAAYYVMGYVDGGSAAQLLKEGGPLPAARAIPILLDVADALAYAHAQGVVHRDIKAENILLDAATGRAMVTDFGIARLAEAAPMTQTGTVLGTVHYMSPEQVNGEPLDGRSDLYAVGVLAFLLLSGRFPFEHEAPSAVLVSHVTRLAPPLRSVARDVPEHVAAIVDRLLAKDRDARFADAEALCAALERADEAAPNAIVAPSARPVAAPVPVVERLSSLEAQEVWERAAMLQQMTGAHSPPPVDAPALGRGDALTRGFKLDEVVAAAGEAGIERKFVERAIAERLPSSPAHPVGGLPAGTVRRGSSLQSKPSFWVGSPTRLEWEAVVDGELSADDLEEIVDEIRRHVHEFGSVSTVGRTITFMTATPSNTGNTLRRMQVIVGSRGGRTTIRAHEDLRQVAGGIIGGVTGGVGGGVGGAAAGVLMGATQSALVAFPTMLAIALGAFTASRYGVHRLSRRKDQELRELVERLARRVEELVAQPTEIAPAPAPRRLKR